MSDEPYDPDLQRRLQVKGLASGAAVEVARALYQSATGQGVSWGIITGHGPPGSGKQLADLDGVNDPWRWSSTYLGWVLLRHMSWDVGATLSCPELYFPLHFELYAENGQGLSINAAGGTFSMPHLANQVDSPVTAEEAGDGVVFLVQYEPDYAMTHVPDSGVDIMSFLTGFTDLGEYTLNEITTGSDGQMYLDIDTRILYGPRINGHWSALSLLPGPQ